VSITLTGPGSPMPQHVLPPPTSGALLQLLGSTHTTNSALPLLTWWNGGAPKLCRTLKAARHVVAKEVVSNERTLAHAKIGFGFDLRRNLVLRELREMIEISKINHAQKPKGHGTNLNASNQSPMDRSCALPPRVKRTNGPSPR
jgi:hypothetical protein